MFSWIKKLLFGKPAALPSRPAAPAPAKREQKPAEKSSKVALEDVPAALPKEQAPAGVPNLDSNQVQASRLEIRDRALLDRIRERIETGNIKLPQLPSTSLAAMDLASSPTAEINEIVSIIRADPVLASELLRAANSVVYGSKVDIDNLHDAVMRLGLRSLRSMILSLSMRGMILRHKALTYYAEEVWRQSFSVANIARMIADRTGEDPERCFLVGLLHDLGKIALLALLPKEMEKGSQLSNALVGKIFLHFHEDAGRTAAAKWKLSDEIASVAGRHHDYRGNEDFPKSAALASLAHRMDLYLSMDEGAQYDRLYTSDQMDVLEIDEDRRHIILRDVRRWFEGERERKRAEERAKAEKKAKAKARTQGDAAKERAKKRAMGWNRMRR